MAKEKKSFISRRDFLVGSGAVIAAGALTACTPKAVTDTTTITSTTTKTQPPVTITETVPSARRNIPQELPLPGLRPLGTTEYTCDVLVIGASYAGAQAALGAYAAGQKVIVVDKGIPGKSGAGPWANTLLFFDERFGDNRESWINSFQRNVEYIVDQDYLDVFMEHSLAGFKRWVDLGIVNDCHSIPTPEELIRYSQGTFRPE